MVENYDDACKNAQRVASKYGYTIVCDEDEVEEATKVSQECKDAKEVATKYGYTVICDED